MIEGIQTLTAHVRDGTIGIPPPPDSVGTWPIIGGPLHNLWNTASTNLSGLLKNLAPQIKALLPWLLSASAAIGLTVLQFVLSIVVAGVLLANASGCGTVTRSLAHRLFGDRGPEFEDLAGPRYGV
jgi:predicted PurR-regulated permease PerM